MTGAEISELVGGIVVVLAALTAYLKSRTATATSAHALARIRAHEAVNHAPVTLASPPPPVVTAPASPVVMPAPLPEPPASV